MKRILIDSSFAFIMRELMEGVTLYIRERPVPWQIYYASVEEFLPALASKPDGALTVLSRPRESQIKAVKRSRIPTVNVLRNLAPDVPSVASDHVGVGAAAADYFLSRGFKHFAFLGTDRDWSEGRFAGFEARLRKAGHVPIQLHLSLSNDKFRQIGNPRVSTVIRKWLRTLPQPVAVFAAADYIARPVLEACEVLGIAVPEQISVLGVDNDPAICDLGPVALSSIPQNFMRMGFEAARMLDGLMAKRRKPRGPVWIPPREVVVRRSTDFIAAANPHVAAGLRFIHAAEREISTVKSLLQHIGVSRQWLDLQFKEAIGRTPSEEIRRVKLARARTLLLQTHLSVHEIARRCGFSYAENLTRFLQDQVGMSPRELRERHRFTG
jgi:LacI family transcriptional regulator